MSIRSTAILLAAVLWSASLLGQTLPPAPLGFRNVDLPGAQVTFAAGINNQGQIVGDFQDAAGVFHGYLANEDGSLQSVLDFPGAAQTDAFSINEKGDIVGSYVDSSGSTHGFLLTNGNFSSIDFPNAVFTSAEGINDRGDIAGLYFNSGFDIHGFTLDENGFTTIDDPQQGSPANTQVFTVNNRREIVGIFVDAAGALHGFLLAHGAFTTIDAPGAAQATVVLGLSDSSAIVGDFVGADGSQHGYLLRNNTFSTVDFPNGSQSNPSQINASGSIVGIYADNAGNFHSFLAERSQAGETGAFSNEATPQTSAVPVNPLVPSGGNAAAPGPAYGAGGRHPLGPGDFFACQPPQ